MCSALGAAIEEATACSSYLSLFILNCSFNFILISSIFLLAVAEAAGQAGDPWHFHGGWPRANEAGGGDLRERGSSRCLYGYSSFQESLRKLERTMMDMQEENARWQARMPFLGGVEVAWKSCSAAI